jgi:hypothetical protein
VDNRQEPGVSLNRRWPSQASVITRQISKPMVYTNRWEAPPVPPPIRSTGFMLALQVKPARVKPQLAWSGRAEYDTFYVLPAVGIFPTQYAGLRTFYGGTVKELCLVAQADAPAGLGGEMFINKSGTTYSVYLVETTDPNASSVRINTTTGTKAVRLKT